MKMNGCVTGPVSEDRQIILNRADGDIIIAFQCLDLTDGGTKCEFLVERSPVTADLVRCMSESFTTIMG
jgi:hypothetical protein